MPQNKPCSSLPMPPPSGYMRHLLQDWNVWLSQPDEEGNDVNIQFDNIYLRELQESDQLLYEKLKVFKAYQPLMHVLSLAKRHERLVAQQERPDLGVSNLRYNLPIEKCYRIHPPPFPISRCTTASTRETPRGSRELLSPIQA